MFMLQPFSFYLHLSSLLDTKCSGQNTCPDCFSLPGCGWCANSRSTGIGVCMDGTNRGDRNAVCPASRWHYTKCPSKHLSGHHQRAKEPLYFNICIGLVQGRIYMFLHRARFCCSSTGLDLCIYMFLHRVRFWSLNSFPEERCLIH